MAEGQMPRGSELGWGGLELVGTAWNGLGIDERVQDNVRKRAQGPEGVQRPKMESESDGYICKGLWSKASLWGSMR